MRRILPTVTAVLTLMSTFASAQESKYYEVPKGDYPHDVLPVSLARFGMRVRWPASQADSIQRPGRSNASSWQEFCAARGHRWAGAPNGWGPYGITATPKGDIWFVSLAGSYLANVDIETGAATVYEPPTKDRGTRRVWSDSKGRMWISEWNTGNVSVYDLASKAWKSVEAAGRGAAHIRCLGGPGRQGLAFGVTANAVVRFDPVTEKFKSFPSDRPKAEVRQMLGRKGEAWIAESGTERLRVITYTVDSR